MVMMTLTRNRTFYNCLTASYLLLLSTTTAVLLILLTGHSLRKAELIPASEQSPYARTGLLARYGSCTHYAGVAPSDHMQAWDHGGACGRSDWWRL